MFFNKSSNNNQTINDIDYDPKKLNYNYINDACWKSGENVPFYALAKTFSEIESINSRLKSIEIMSNYLSSVMLLSSSNDNDYDQLIKSIYLCLNKVAPDYEGIELGIGTSILMKALSEATGRNMTQLKKQLITIGDIGSIAETSKTNQRLLMKPKPLTVSHVFNTFYSIATMTGRNVMSNKVEKIKSLITASKPIESRYIMRALSGKLRIGLGEKSLLTSIAQAFMIYKHNNCDKSDKKLKINTDEFKEKLNENVKLLQKSFNECPNYQKLLTSLIPNDFNELSKYCYLSPGIPLKPMLANPTKGIHEIFKRLEGQKFTCEYKYDGERAQIHMNNTGDIFIFSRNQENNTKKYPDIIKLLKDNIINNGEIKSFILDCEVVAYDYSTKQILPFQILSTRKRKNVNEQEINVNICLFIFDLIYFNNESLVKQSFNERRTILMKNFKFIENRFMHVTYKDLNDIESIQEFLDESIKNKCEGLMIKTLFNDASYEIAKRSFKWLKLKKDYLDNVGDTIDLIPIGAYYGRGKRTGVYGGFLLSCYDEKNDEFQCICKIGTGFSDDNLQKLSNQLNEIVISKPKSYYRVDDQLKCDVWFEAKYVWEIKCADLSKSPIYKAAIGIIDNDKGISLRFPRFIRIREDKKPEMATTSAQIAEMYLNQENQMNNNVDNKDDDDDDDDDYDEADDDDKNDKSNKNDDDEEFY